MDINAIIWGGVLLLATFVVLAGFTVRLLIAILRPRRPVPRPGKQHALTREVPPWPILVALTIGLATGVIASVLAHRIPWLAAGSWSMLLIPLVFLATCLLWFAAIVSYLWLAGLQDRDPLSIRAIKRAGEGDLDGAFREMIEGIETAGPTAVRLSTLAYLYDKKDAHEEALGALNEAAKLGKRLLPLIRLNQALALRELGRPEEALPLIEEARVKAKSLRTFKFIGDGHFIAYCHCLVMADLGRIDEASDLYRAALARPKVRFASPAIRESLDKLLQKCADRLVPKPAIRLDDLAEPL
jgi:tetratricopeptide (TPR) repeat protein